MQQFHFSLKDMTNEEMKNPDEKVNIGGFAAKKAVFRGRGLLTYTWMITKIYHPTLILSYNDMIYTYANM